jgi:predicted amidophosphoribosyltransferase
MPITDVDYSNVIKFFCFVVRVQVLLWRQAELLGHLVEDCLSCHRFLRRLEDLYLRCGKQLMFRGFQKRQMRFESHFVIYDLNEKCVEKENHLDDEMLQGKL